MRTLIINGSPKADKGNTEVFIRQFVKGMKNPCEICYAAREDRQKISAYMKEFDSVIVAMPLYIHSMPGILMKLVECMEPAAEDGKSMGFIVQSGFLESAQSKYLERHLSALARRLNYAYLGTVIKGGSAGTYLMPEKMNRELFDQLNRLGKYFEENGSFDQDVIRELAEPSTLSSKKSRSLQRLNRIGLGDSLFWNIMLMQNKALSKRNDQPFIEKLP